MGTPVTSTWGMQALLLGSPVEEQEGGGRLSTASAPEGRREGQVQECDFTSTAFPVPSAQVEDARCSTASAGPMSGR